MVAMDDFWYSFWVKHLFESINVYVKIKIRNKNALYFTQKNRLLLVRFFIRWLIIELILIIFEDDLFIVCWWRACSFLFYFFLSSFQEVHLALFIINWSRVHYIILISEKEIILFKINLNRLMVNEVLYKWIPINT